MITLILGGARSGKSEYAERLAASRDDAVTYVATATPTTDVDFQERIRRHRQRRPSAWRTAEPGRDLIEYLEGVDPESTLLIDSLGVWVAGSDDFGADAAALCRILTRRSGHAIVVAEEVGLGVHPSTDVGGRFRDALGLVNQAVAGVADEVFLIVAGRALRLEAGV